MSDLRERMSVPVGARVLGQRQRETEEIEQVDEARRAGAALALPPQRGEHAGERLRIVQRVMRAGQRYAEALGQRFELRAFVRQARANGNVSKKSRSAASASRRSTGMSNVCPLCATSTRSPTNARNRGQTSANRRRRRQIRVAVPVHLSRRGGDRLVRADQRMKSCRPPGRFPPAPRRSPRSRRSRRRSPSSRGRTSRTAGNGSARLAYVLELQRLEQAHYELPRIGCVGTQHQVSRRWVVVRPEHAHRAHRLRRDEEPAESDLEAAPRRDPHGAARPHGSLAGRPPARPRRARRPDRPAPPGARPAGSVLAHPLAQQLGHKTAGGSPVPGPGRAGSRPDR